MLTLSIEGSDGVLRSAQVARLPCLIGRSAEADIVLSGWRVARAHAHLERVGSGYRVVDLGSLSGTWVNGDRCLEYGPLTESDEIFIAGHRLRLIPSPEHVSLTRPQPPPDDQGGQRIESEGDETSRAQVGDTSHAWRRLLHRKLLAQIDLRRKDVRQWTDQQLRDEARQIFEQVIDQEGGFPTDINREVLIREAVSEAVGLGPLEALMADESISEIMVNGTAPIHVERAGRIVQTGLAFSSEDAIRSVIDRIVSPIGRHIDEGSPMVDARLPDGSRLNAVIPPVSLNGPAVTIRRFNRRVLSPSELIARGSASPAVVEFLRCCVSARLNLVIAGGTGSGKTTLLNVLSGFIEEHERVITVEDAAELRLQHRNLVALEARPANAEGRGRVSIRDLVRNALRMRPDRIIVGECRGEEALDMLQAMNTGHDGSLTTVHANSPRDVLSRIEVMTMMAGIEMPVVAIREQIASAVQIVVQQSRMSDGSRRITDIAEIAGIEGGKILMQSLFRFHPETMRYIPTGQLPSCFDRQGRRMTDECRRLFEEDQ